MMNEKYKIQKIADYLWVKQTELAGTVRAIAHIKEESPEADPQILLDKLAIVTAQNEVIKDITAIIEGDE